MNGNKSWYMTQTVRKVGSRANLILLKTRYRSLTALLKEERVLKAKVIL